MLEEKITIDSELFSEKDDSILELSTKLIKNKEHIRQIYKKS